MSLESEIARIATALEVIAQKLGTAAPASESTKKSKATAAPAPEPVSTVTQPALPPPTPAPEPTPAIATVTIEQIRAVGMKVIALGKKTEMDAVFAKAGGKLTTLPATIYPDVLKALNELLTPKA
jgi:hypothetical protein